MAKNRDDTRRDQTKRNQTTPKQWQGRGQPAATATETTTTTTRDNDEGQGRGQQCRRGRGRGRTRGRDEDANDTHGATERAREREGVAEGDSAMSRTQIASISVLLTATLRGKGGKVRTIAASSSGRRTGLGVKHTLGCCAPAYVPMCVCDACACVRVYLPSRDATVPTSPAHDGNNKLNFI